MQPDVEEELAHSREYLKRQLGKKANACPAGRKAGVVRTAVAFDRTVLTTVQADDWGNQMGRDVPVDFFEGL